MIIGDDIISDACQAMRAVSVSSSGGTSAEPLWEHVLMYYMTNRVLTSCLH